jgi:hypothetical protein
VSQVVQGTITALNDVVGPFIPEAGSRFNYAHLPASGTSTFGTAAPTLERFVPDLNIWVAVKDASAGIVMTSNSNNRSWVVEEALPGAQYRVRCTTAGTASIVRMSQ